MCLGDVLVKGTLPGEHSAALPAHGLLINPLITLVNTLDVLRQVGAAAKKFIANVTLERFLSLDLRGDVGVDELDVVAEVGGVRADSAAGGAAHMGPAPS